MHGAYEHNYTQQRYKYRRGAFTGCTGLTSITIPFVGAASDGAGSTKFEYIFEAYFSEPDDDQDDGVPSSLRTVVITGGTNIDRWAFSDCSNITSITISGVEKICHEAFSGCSGLTSVVIGDGVTSIESGVFSECSSLTNITIPDSITSIDGELFRDCSSLEYNTYEGGRYLGCEDNPYLILVSATDKNITSCKIHEKTRFVCGAAFYDCYSLEAVHITDLAAWLRINFSDAYANPLEYARDLYLSGEKISGDVVIPDGVTDIPAATFMNCTGLTSITIPDSVTSIGSFAFYSCKGLTSINIPDSVASIGVWAFYGCTGLTSINIPNGMTSISAHSFSECTSLTSVTIPEGVVNIDGNAFSYCSALTSVTIPASVTSIDYDSFYGCKDIDGMSVSKGNSVYHSAGNCLIETDTKTIIIGFNNSFIPMDGSVTNISDNAFSGCSRLVAITMPESVTSIGYGAFENCENLLVIKNKSDLELSIGSTDNGNVAYSAYLIIDKQGNKTYRDGYIYTDDGFVYEKEGESYRLVAYTGGEYMVTLPSKLVLDGAEYDYEIYRIRGVRDVTIPVGATKIDDYAFYECESLKSVYISDGVTSIGRHAFFGCSGLKGIAIPESVTDIGDKAFYNCSSLMDIIIPSGVENIGYEAFHGCTKLDFSVYDNAKYLGNQSNPYIVLIEVTGADITSCQIHADTKVIASDAFSDCSNLTSITVPDSVTSICYGAFMGCSGLESITIPFVGATIDGTNSTHFSWIFGVDRNIELPSGLKSVVITGGASIDENAFNGCENLTSITISDSVTSIGYNAFIWCSGLTDISYLGTKEQWSGISKGADWNFSTGDYTVHCSDGDLTKAES